MNPSPKAASNRKNAQKSTGSAIGRQRSSRNALRHGLAVAIGSDPSFSGEIEVLRIRRLRASQFKAIFENEAVTLSEYAELSESLAKLERYERRAIARRKRALLAITGN
jgi:hypothetical protein